MARREVEEQSRRWHTWHGAALPMAKKLPTFAEFVRPAPPPEERPVRQSPQSVEEQVAVMKAIFSRAHGKS